MTSQIIFNSKNSAAPVVELTIEADPAKSSANVNFRTESSNTFFHFSKQTEVIQYITTLLQMIVLCHEEDVKSATIVIPGYPVTNLSLADLAIRAKSDAIIAALAEYMAVGRS